MQSTNMPWTDLVTPFSKLWLETGTQAWQNWLESWEKSGSLPANPMMKPAFQNFSQKLAENQSLYAQLLQTSFQTWQELWPKLDNTEVWQPSFSQYLSQIQQQLQQSLASSQQVAQDLSQLWQLYGQELQKFNQLWYQSALSSLAPLGQTLTGESKPWMELNNLYWNLLYEESFGSLMRSPILGPTRDLTGKLLKGFDSWTELYQASTDYQLLLGEIQYRSLEMLMKELIQRAQGGNIIKDWRQFQQVWSAVADQVFEDAFRQEDNLKIRGKFINSLNRYRLQQQALLEDGLKSVNMPTRSEIDEIHKSLYELKKEVKSLKKRLARYEPESN
jgi:class III poly(R)-hydroxyalkanoic acid synthase PhaE subunit